MTNENKFNAFISELEALCKKFDVQISVSGYDSLVISDLKSGDEPIYANGIKDNLRVE